LLPFLSGPRQNSAQSYGAVPLEASWHSRQKFISALVTVGLRLAQWVHEHECTWGFASGWFCPWTCTAGDLVMSKHKQRHTLTCSSCMCQPFVFQWLYYVNHSWATSLLAKALMIASPFQQYFKMDLHSLDLSAFAWKVGPANLIHSFRDTMASTSTNQGVSLARILSYVSPIA
jgi:hypothetical protein